jgi:alkylhydroperoxidase/carboxymuconolactone decarboxylase family protein YurZ
MVTDREGLWGSALDTLRGWDPEWAVACHAMSVRPWRSKILNRRFVELICVALNASPTTQNAVAIRRHTRAALAAGASRDEILFVIKCATVMSVRALGVAAPILLQEIDADDMGDCQPEVTPSPSCDALRAAGHWNEAWDAFQRLDPHWTEQLMKPSAAIYDTELFSDREIELLNLALDASVNHLYAAGIRRHIQRALAAGATSAEILAVLQLCVGQGVQSANLAVPILEDELSLANGHVAM